MENELEKALENKFISSAKFSEEIEKIVSSQKINYIDAIVFYCEENTIDLESIPKLISKPLKEKIKYEAMELNFLKKTSRAKLIF
jgi:DNA-binding GntR family transcriptional regulator